MFVIEAPIVGRKQGQLPNTKIVRIDPARCQPIAEPAAERDSTVKGIPTRSSSFFIRCEGNSTPCTRTHTHTERKTDSRMGEKEGNSYCRPTLEPDSTVT